MKPATYYLCTNCNAFQPIKYFKGGECECHCGNTRRASGRWHLVEVENYIYEKGDRVRIISLNKWEEEIPDSEGSLYEDIDPGVDHEMIDDYSNRKATVTKITNAGYIMIDIDGGDYYWSALWLTPELSEDVRKLKSCLKDDLFEL